MKYGYRERSWLCVLAWLAAGCAASISDDELSGVTELTQELEADAAKGGNDANGGKGDEVLYVGDDEDSSVKAFDAKTGAYKGDFVVSGAGGLAGPRGLVFGKGGNLLVVNQNVDMPYPGELDVYRKKTGEFLSALVPHTAAHAPYAPRGVVKRGKRLYIADMGEPGYVLDGGAPPNPSPARIAVFDEEGRWERDLAYAGFAETCNNGVCTQWSPRSLVFGPDDALYVSLMKFTSVDDPNTLPGRVIKFNDRGQATLVVDGDTCRCGLARPEGLVFGPDNKLYVTSFRKSVSDIDKILVFNRNGAYVDKIELAPAGAERAAAQALIFGPNKLLYVPITLGGPAAGSVRAYDVRTKTFKVVVQPGAELGAPFYLTFSSTDPATLAFH